MSTADERYPFCGGGLSVVEACRNIAAVFFHKSRIIPPPRGWFLFAMNRLQQSAQPPMKVFGNREPEISSALFSFSETDASCALFAPLHYESGYAYPLIVWLHGPGADERQLMRIMPAISMRNYVAVAPEAVGAEEPWPQTLEAIQEAEARVFASVETAHRKFHISPKRIFLAGFDTGGAMAFRIALNHPDRFAGVVSLCGPFPAGHHPFGHLNEARKLPVFLAAGRDSDRYPQKVVCDNLRLLYTAGLSLTLRQYPCDQQLCPQMLRDLDRWLIDQITESPC